MKDVIAFVEQELDGNDYERGAVEAAYAQANNTTEAFARLCDLLVKQKTLTMEELFYVVKGYTKDTDL